MTHVMNLQDPQGHTQSELMVATIVPLGAGCSMGVSQATSTSQDLPTPGVAGMGHGTRRSF